MSKTPFHLAAYNRPECLKLLLEHADEKLLDHRGAAVSTAVNYALISSREICQAQHGTLCDARCPCTDTLEMLLGTNCALCPDRYHRYIFSAASQRSKVKYAEGLRTRRESLKTLALKHLPFSEVEYFGLKEAVVLDAHVVRVTKRLQECGVAVPAACNIGGPFQRCYQEYTPIYHILEHSYDADIFFNLGFRDIDVADVDGFPGLAIHGRRVGGFHYCLWLVEHGARPFRHLEYTSHTRQQDAIGGATSAHWVFCHIGREISLPGFDWIRDDLEWKVATSQLNAQVLSVDVKDECRCRCSRDGCSPFLWMLKQWTVLRSSMRSRRWHGTVDISNYIKYFGRDMEAELFEEAVRFMTFETLGIQHTCCGGGSGVRVPNYDPGDIREIQEGQAALLQTLEDLVREFEGKISGILEQGTPDVPVDLAAFWTGYWSDRMEEVLEELDGCDISYEEKAEAERIGVKWDDESSKTKTLTYEYKEDLGDWEDWEGLEGLDDFSYWLRRIEEIA